MTPDIQLLDCTLRDGSYIVNGAFGAPVLRGVMRKLAAANIDIIECGWLKDAPYQPGSAYYHVPADVKPYLPERPRGQTVYAVMIDWDRYDLDALPPCDGESVDAIRMVFPFSRFKEAIPLGFKIKERGYRLYLQAANTLNYNDEELMELAREVNRVEPEVLSIVDTFGAMYPEDLERIDTLLDGALNPGIRLGFHSHNNQQLSFALSMEFLRLGEKSRRGVVADASLCGMGRGAGNTTTELLANYVNRKYRGGYDLNEIMDTIDLYLSHLEEDFHWGYSIPYCIAGIYCTHVNNINYLLKNHHTLARDMKLIIESMLPEERKGYDYGKLEERYVNYQNRVIDDADALAALEERFRGREVLLLGPGRTLTTHQERILRYISERRPAVISVNMVPEKIPCDGCFFANPSRYLYAQENFASLLKERLTILTSNVKREPDAGEKTVNFNLLCKPGWQFFDNGCIMALRLMAKLRAGRVTFAGFDGFPEEEVAPAHFYADKVTQPTLTPEKRRQINADVTEMLRDFAATDRSGVKIGFLTPSRFDKR